MGSGTDPLRSGPRPLSKLWRQFRLWPGPAPTYTCPQSPQLINPVPSQLQEHLSVQMFHNCSLDQAICRGLVHGSHSCKGRFYLFFLSCTACGAQLWFQSHLCMWTTLRHLLPTKARGSGHGNPLGFMCSLKWEGEEVVID